MSIALLQGCKESNRSVKVCKIIQNIRDVKGWLLPNTEQLHNHSHPHIFKFVKGAQDTAEMYYKRWNEDSWEPVEHQGLKLLKVCKTF